MDKHKYYKADGVDDGQPKRNEDADRLDVWLVELSEKQICALEVLDQGVQGLLDALLESECQEENDLLEVGPLFFVFQASVPVNVPSRCG